MPTNRFLRDSQVPALVHHSAEQAHYERARYGDFLLTSAIRPLHGTGFEPVAGHRQFEWTHKTTGETHDVIVAAVSAENLFDVFLELASAMGETFSVVLETSHGRPSGDTGHDHLWAHGLDNVCARSTLCDFEDMILNDGCAGACILKLRPETEVQLTEHKTFEIYGHKLGRFQRILEGAGLVEKPGMKFIHQVQHLHVSSPELREAFERLTARFGAELVEG